MSEPIDDNPLFQALLQARSLSNSERYLKSLEDSAIKRQEMLLLEVEERFLLDRAVRRKYGEAIIGDAKSEAARLREIALEISHVFDTYRFFATVKRSASSGSSPTHSNAET